MAGEMNKVEAVAKKSSPFSTEMDLALATSYIEEKSIIEGPLKGSKLTNKHKQASWERVRGCVNAVAGGNEKAVVQCKDRYRNLVQAITKRKWQVTATGGGPSPPPLSQPQLIIESSLSRLKLEGIDSAVDTFSAQAALPQTAACEVVMIDSVYSMPITIVDDDTPSPSFSLDACPRKRKSSMAEGEYLARKMAILEKEHPLRSRMILAQARYYEIKTEILLKKM